MKRRGSAQTGPLPSVAAGIGPFIVDQSDLPPGISGAVGKLKDGQRIYATPRDNSPTSIAIRAHEYGHLATNRLGLPEDLGKKFHEAGVVDSWNQTIQDMLANAYMMNAGSNSICDLPLEHDFKVDVTNKADWKGLASFYLRSRYLTACEAKRYEVYAKFKSIELTETLHEAINLVDYIVQDNDWAGFNQQLIELGVKLQTIYGPWPGGSNPSYGEEGQWGSMKIIQCDLQAQRALRRKMKTSRRAYVGAFKHPLQALAPAFDGKCFSLPHHVPGGSILVDLSGSMQIESSQLVDLLSAVPAATVAGYSSATNDLARGVLGILAQNGKCVNSRPREFGNGNVVDGPALDWLAQQPEPRIWVCDGVVTGVGDDIVPELTSEAYRKVADNNITRVNNIAEAKLMLSQK